jgi:hypothetical protein
MKDEGSRMNPEEAHKDADPIQPSSFSLHPFHVVSGQLPGGVGICDV